MSLPALLSERYVGLGDALLCEIRSRPAKDGSCQYKPCLCSAGVLRTPSRIVLCRKIWLRDDRRLKINDPVALDREDSSEHSNQSLEHIELAVKRDASKARRVVSVLESQQRRIANHVEYRPVEVGVNANDPSIVDAITFASGKQQGATNATQCSLCSR